MITTSPTSTACVDPVATYHATFPALQSLSWHKDDLAYSQFGQKRHHPILNSTHLEHPWTPPYLYQTHYAALVRKQCLVLLQKRNDNDKKLMNDTIHQHLVSSCISLDTSDRLATMDLRLPSIMNAADKSCYLEIDDNGLGVNYNGPGRSEDHSGTVRANLPIPIQCGVYYYEMHVKSNGVDGYIGIGFCNARNELKRLPGWDKLSFGYHGDDGHKFEGSGIGKKYGPQFQSGDVIGCGVDFANKAAFYTKNGTFLGIAFQDLDLSLPMFPCVGMRTSGEYAVVNFGQDSFVFDIVHYIQEQKMALWKDIASYSIPTSATLTVPPLQASVLDKENIDPNVAAEYSNNTSPSMDQLILSYMIHHGYTDSAAALKKNSVYLSEPNFVNHGVLVDDNDGLLQRLAVKKAVESGDIDRAIELLSLHFPTVLKTTKNDSSTTHSILFQLKCQKFIEMIGDYDTNECQQQQGNEMNISRSSSSSASDDGMTTLSSSSSSSSSNSNSNRNNQGYRVYQHHDSISNNSSSSNGIQHNKKQVSSGKLQIVTEMDSDSDDDETKVSSLEYLRLQSIMAYGQELKNEFGQESAPIIMDKLKQVFSLLAYSDPSSSPMGYLLARSNRETLANDVNVAILVHQNQPEMSALDCVYRQLLAVNKELSYLGHGHSAFLDLAQE